MRSFFGILFIVLAVFAVKWQFTPAKIAWDNTEPHTYRRRIVWDSPPPLDEWMEITQAGAMAAIGFYLIASGEWASWRGQPSRYSINTLNAVFCWFVGVFALKFAYNFEVGAYHPPFDNNDLELLDLFHIITSFLALYFFIRGEFAFWRWKPQQLNGGTTTAG